MKKLPVGLQVYGLRDLLENTPEQFARVMKEVKAICGMTAAGSRKV